MAEELRSNIRDNFKKQIQERILREQDGEGQYAKELEKIMPNVDETIKELVKEVTDSLEENPVQSWRDPVKEVAESFKPAETSCVFHVVPAKEEPRRGSIPIPERSDFWNSGFLAASQLDENGQNRAKTRNAGENGKWQMNQTAGKPITSKLPHIS